MLQHNSWHKKFVKVIVSGHILLPEEKRNENFKIYLHYGQSNTFSVH